MSEVVTQQGRRRKKKSRLSRGEFCRWASTPPVCKKAEKRKVNVTKTGQGTWGHWGSQAAKDAKRKLHDCLN